jgi:hypothetical protein
MDGTGDVDGDGLGAGDVDSDELGAGDVDSDDLGAGDVDSDDLGAGDVDGDELGVGDGDAVGDAEDVGLVAVGDADGTGDLDGDGDGDGEVLLPGDSVPRDVRVSITGTMSAGTTLGKALGDDDAVQGDTDGSAGGDEAGLAAGVDRVAATLGWAADGCSAAPDRAKLTAADAARTMAATPVATSGRHQRRRDIWSRPGERAGPNQGRPEAARPGPGVSSGEAGRTTAVA